MYGLNSSLYYKCIKLIQHEKRSCSRFQNTITIPDEPIAIPTFNKRKLKEIIFLTEGMNIEKDSITRESDIMMTYTSAVMNLVLKVRSIYYMIWLRNFLALFGKNISKLILLWTSIKIPIVLSKEMSEWKDMCICALLYCLCIIKNSW